MSPIERLRCFFATDEILKPMATQIGFAKFLGRSEPLIRSIEKGRLKVSEKLARKISSMTGVREDWLHGSVKPTDPIPGRDGGMLTVEKLKDSIMNHGFMPKYVSDTPNNAVESVTHLTMIDSVITMIRAELIESTRKPIPNVPDPLVEMLEWVYKRASARSALSSKARSGTETSGPSGDSGNAARPKPGGRSAKKIRDEL